MSFLPGIFGKGLSGGRVLNEEIHPLVGEDLRIIQKPGHYRFGLEAVLLANMVRGRPGLRAADLGSGDGVIPLLLAYKKRMRVTGYEIQKSLVEMARKSCALNKLEGLVEIRQQDIREIPGDIRAGTFDLVTANPPFFSPDEGRISPKKEIALARHELACTLEDVITAASHLLKEGGDFFLAHRPDRLVEIFSCCQKAKLEPKVLQPVQPRPGEEANMVLLRCRRGGKTGLKLNPPLSVYQGSDYSHEMRAIYRGEEKP